MSSSKARAWGRGAGVSIVLAGLASGWGLAAEGCGSGDGVVGGSCASGFTDCNNQCVNLQTDPNNCGVCGNVCAGSGGADTCSAGHCGLISDAHAEGSSTDAGHADAKMTTDGTVLEGSAEASQASETGREGATLDAPVSDVISVEGSLDAPVSDSPTSDVTKVDGTTDAPSDGPVGDVTPVDGRQADVIQCFPPYVTPSNCGGCGRVCADAGVCSPVLDAGSDGIYQCVTMCTAPLVACSGTCVDEQADPANCGQCGKVCASGICTMGVCEGSTAGDLVIIGHDYAASSILQSEATLLVNAVFLPPTNPLRVLSLEEYAVGGQVTNVKATLAKYAPVGRTISYVVANDYTAVPAELNAQTFDVLLVYDQATAPSGTLATVGQTLASSIASFIAVGGDVVVLDGASGTTKEMTAFLSNANILQTTAETPVPLTDRLHVVAPGDAVGNFVLSPYRPIADSVYFTTSEANGPTVTYIVDDVADGGLVPVVIHKTPGP